jgi:hypothetical protein
MKPLLLNISSAVSQVVASGDGDDVTQRPAASTTHIRPVDHVIVSWQHHLASAEASFSQFFCFLLAVAKLEMSFIGFANYKKLGYKLK